MSLPTSLALLRSSVGGLPRCPRAMIAALWLAGVTALQAQVPAPASTVSPARAAGDADDSVIELSVFVVSSETESGYQAKETLAGMRIKTDLKDVGAAIDVLTESFLDDVGVTNMFDALQYVPNMEYNSYPSDSDANNSTQWFSASYKSRGVSGNTVLQDFFSTGSVPIDRYNTENLTLLRGANAILFGIGSPSGIVGSSTKRAKLSQNIYTARLTTDVYGSLRGELDVSRVLLRNRLAFRLAAVAQDKHTYQEPSLNRRNALTGTVTYKPFKRTSVTVTGETGIYDRLHVQNGIVWDGYTPWVLAGKPTVNFVTGKGMTNGSTTKGQYSTAVGSGLQNNGSASLLTYIEGSGLPIMDWRNMARGARWGNMMAAAPAGVYNSGLILSTDRSHLDFTGFNEGNAIVKLNANPWGGMNTNDLRYNSQSVFIEQNITRDLDVELAWNRFEQTYVFNLFGMQNYINVDPNEVLPDGSPNPYVGMPYIETGNGGNATRKTGEWREFENKRVTLSYRLDLDRIRPFGGVGFLRNIGLGDYRFAGLYAVEGLNTMLWASRYVNVTPIPGSPTSIPLNQNVNRLNRRYYLKPGESSFVFGGPWTFQQSSLPGAPAANSGPVRIEERASDETPRNHFQSTTSWVAAVQAAWFKTDGDGGGHLLTGMFGKRWDTRRANAQSFTRLPSGEYAIPLHSFSGIAEAGTWGQQTSFDARTKSYNLTLRAHRAVRVFYNYSDIFSGGASNFTDVFDRPLRPTKGDTRDYGVKIDLLGERLFVSLTKYKTTIFDQTMDNTGTVREPINQIYDALHRPDLTLVRPFSYRDDSSTGYEATVVASPTDRWRLRGTLGTQKTFVSANMDEWVDYHETMMPLWEAGLDGQGRATPLVSQSSGYTNVGHAIDRAVQRLRDARAIIGTRPTSQRGVNASFTTSYAFGDGPFKGFRAGAGLRWASANILGYARDANGNSDPSRPFWGRPQVSTDASLGYSRKIARDKANWDIQFNVYNITNDRKPHYRTAVDDGRGNPAYARNYLPDPIGIQVTNTVRF